MIVVGLVVGGYSVAEEAATRAKGPAARRGERGRAARRSGPGRAGGLRRPKPAFEMDYKAIADRLGPEGETRVSFLSLVEAQVKAQAEAKATFRRENREKMVELHKKREEAIATGDKEAVKAVGKELRALRAGPREAKTKAEAQMRELLGPEKAKQLDKELRTESQRAGQMNALAFRLGRPRLLKEVIDGLSGDRKLAPEQRTNIDALTTRFREDMKSLRRGRDNEEARSEKQRKFVQDLMGVFTDEQRAELLEKYGSVRQSRGGGRNHRAPREQRSRRGGHAGQARPAEKAPAE